MRQKVLILTVGGSPAPIIHAIEFYKPDFIYFLASSGNKGSGTTINGQGDPCGDKRKMKCPNCGDSFYPGNPKGKSITAQTGLNENQYSILLLDDPDDLDGCYALLAEISAEIIEKYPSAEVIANFTGGTKVMSASLAFFGVMKPEWKLSLNIAKRENTIRVTSGDTPVFIDKWRIFCEQKMSEARRALKQYDYETAEQIFSEFLMQPLERNYQDQLREWINMCKAFICWDRYDHSSAFEFIQGYGRSYAPYILILKKILKQDKKHSGYELVSDLVNNAERKAKQGRYDDAVARLYRATELFGQIRLKTVIPGSELGRLKLDDLPEKLQPDYEARARGNQLLLGLSDVYHLLACLNDEAGGIYKKMENQILSALYKRNDSIYAHGLSPLSLCDYQSVSETLCGFMQQAARALNVDINQKQLPACLKDAE